MYSQHLNYLPLEPALFFILFVALASLVVLINLGAFSYAFTRLGLHPGLAVWLMFASLLGSYINIPVAHFPHATIVVAREFDQFGIRFIVPSVVDWPGTVIALNVGGAVIPIALSLYLLSRYRLWIPGTLATIGVAAVCHAVAYPIRGVGIAMPIFIPPLATGIIACLISWRNAPALAYISGSLGTLIGADLLNLRAIGRMGAPLASIGGAGTFDGIFLTGITAVLLASLLYPLRPHARISDGN